MFRRAFRRLELAYPAQGVLLYAGYIIVAYTSLQLAVRPDYVTPVWPLAGLILFVLLRYGIHWLPIVWLGDFTIATQLYDQLPVAMLIAGATTCEAYLAAYMLRQIPHITPQFNSLRAVQRLILVASCVAAPAGATLAMLVLRGNGVIDASAAEVVWLRWWLGDCAGMITFMPLLAVMIQRPLPKLKPVEWLEWLIGLSGVVLIANLVFHNSINYTFLLLLFIVWSALRFGHASTIILSALVATMAILATAGGGGPYVIGARETNLLFVQTFLVVFSCTALILGALAYEWQRRNITLQMRIELNQLISGLHNQAQLASAIVQLLNARLQVYCCINLVDHDGQMRQFGNFNPEQASIVSAEWQQQALERKHTLVRVPARRWRWRQLQARQEIALVLAIPMVMHQYHVGVCTIYCRRESHFCDDQGLFEDVGRRLTQAFAHLHLEQLLLQSQKMQAIGRLASNVAHDFNNMLQVINTSLDFIEESLPPNSDATSELALIQDSTRSAGELARQLLSFSRPQGHSLNTVDINTLITQTSRLLERLFKHSIDIIIRLAPEALYIKGSATQLEQVLVNLAINARDAMPKGGSLTITINTTALNNLDLCHFMAVKPGDYCVINVRDTGVGMDEATVQRIFEPFFTTKPEGQGTGLGLATTYGIIKQHNGHIEVTSQLNQGTSFTIYLPLHVPRDAPAAHFQVVSAP